MVVKPGKLWDESAFIRSYFVKYRSVLGRGVAALVAVNMLMVVPPLVIKVIIDSIEAGESLYAIVWWCAVYFAIQLSMAILRYFWRIYLLLGSAQVETDVRKRIVERAASLPYETLEKVDTDNVLALATNDAQSIRRVYDGGMIVLFDSVLYLLFAPAIMCSLAPSLALWTLLPIPVIPVLVHRRQDIIGDRYKIVQKQFGRLMGLARESLAGLRHIRSSAKEAPLTSHFASEGEEYVRDSIALARLESVLPPLLDMVVGLSLLIAVLLGGTRVIEGTLSVGTLVAFLQYLRQIRWPAQAVGIAVVIYQRGQACAARIEEFLNVQVASSETDAEHSDDDYSIPSGQPLISTTSLSYSYPGQKEPAVDQVAFHIAEGEVVALVGDVGSGKSTLVHLLSGLLKNYDGEIHYSGVNSQCFSVQQRAAHVVISPQEAELFHASVSENIAPGRSFESRLQAETVLSEVTHRAGCKGEFLALEHGFATRLGEQGVRLSGGQRQRLSIARGLYSNAKVVLFDDVLAAVDVRTEEQILEALLARREKRAMLLVTHRMSTSRKADRIVVMEAGQIVASGGHEELLRESPWYRQFCELQERAA